MFFIFTRDHVFDKRKLGKTIKACRQPIFNSLSVLKNTFNCAFNLKKKNIIAAYRLIDGNPAKLHKPSCSSTNTDRCRQSANHESRDCTTREKMTPFFGKWPGSKAAGQRGLQFYITFVFTQFHLSKIYGVEKEGKMKSVPQLPWKPLGV